MQETSNFRIGVRLIVLGILATTPWQAARRAPAQEAAQLDRKISVETHQLPPDNGVIPVELRCRQAELSAPDTLENVPCVVRNNTNRSIKAVGVIKSIIMDKDGVIFTVSSSIVLDAFVHLDINAERGGKLIYPGKEVNAGGLPASYGSVVKGVSLAVDYVEFEDDATLGPDTASFRQRIASMRSGAAKYKKWLTQQFNRHANDVKELASLVDREPSPEETGIGNDNEAEGASLYKNYAHRVKEGKGVNALAERLK